MYKSINRTAAGLARRTAFFHTTALVRAASVFNMPAMSPTMTEGGVVSWKVKSGESFSAGDVLLEVETDKATIDVEAQDDGVMWEILVQEGTKEIPVGKPIALLAEPGDDLSALERPALDEAAPKKQEKPKEEKSPAAAPKSVEKDQAAAKSETNSEKSTSGFITKADRSQKLLPSVELLLHKNGISESDAYEKIPASGPHGRILKGDVLAYLGEINSEANSKVAEFINTRSHLDLAHIQLAEPAPKKDERPSKTKEEKPKPSNLVVIKLACDLGEEVSHEKFKYAFDRAVETSIKQTYGKRYPQYTRNPTPSGARSQDELFDDLLAPPATKKRFEVYDVQYHFGKVETQTVDAFDELLGLTRSTSAQPKPSTSIDVVVNVRVDDTVGDAREFVDQFKHSLVEQVPARHLVIE